ncbi:MAG: capsular biosynthesis protein [Gammaproteobacteria bacterium]|nr:capsular biosynthesis protein [Gammaproteobacteria bacterium]
MRRNVLLLQGPIGTFFRDFSKELEQRGFNVFKVNFNGGDRLYFRGPNAIDYTGDLDSWGDYLDRLITNRQIGRIYLFGDCRAYHRTAKKIARQHQISVYVFEEGYIRPNYITLEKDGVNGHSPMITHKLNLNKPIAHKHNEAALSKPVFGKTAVQAMLYYWAAAATINRFPHYEHHRAFSWFPEGSRWIRSGVRKLYYKHKERHMLKEILDQFQNNYFVCPLQVHCDMQVVVHSKYNSIEHFIGEVLNSFARHAPKNKAIVLKHHPLDRGYTDYTTLISNLAGELGISSRVFYVHDVCLPTLLKNAEGTVLINSTVGMSSLFHGTPVKTLGTAVYDIAGLTAGSSLKQFWSDRESVNMDLFQDFRNYLIEHNQLNGNFYESMGGAGPTGVNWPQSLSAEHTWQQDVFAEPSSDRKLRVVAGLDVSPPSLPDEDSSKAA